jgi:hypothetical protein
MRMEAAGSRAYHRGQQGERRRRPPTASPTSLAGFHPPLLYATVAYIRRPRHHQIVRGQEVVELRHEASRLSLFSAGHARRTGANDEREGERRMASRLSVPQDIYPRVLQPRSLWLVVVFLPGFRRTRRSLGVAECVSVTL